MSLLVKSDMENVYLDPSSVHNTRFPLSLATADRLGRLSTTSVDEEATSNLVANGEPSSSPSNYISQSKQVFIN